MYRRLLLLALGTFAIGTDTFVVAGILHPAAASLGVTIAEAGQLVTVFALTYAVGSPVLATLTARWPRRRVLLVALGVFVGANVTTAVSPTYGFVLASRAVAAIGAALFTPNASVAAAAIAAPERRGRALAVVMGGLSAGLALGAPAGTLLGAVTGWRATMWFVAALGVVPAVGIAAWLPAIPTPPALRLRDRLAPIGDPRVASVLLTSLLALTGLYTVYTYITVAMGPATRDAGSNLAALLLTFGVAATAGNLGAGALIDRFGTRRVIDLAAAIAIADFALLPLSSLSFATAAIAMAVWGVCGWSIPVPQQHRLLAVAPAAGPLVLSLNGSAMYLAASASGLIGGAGVQVLGGRWLGPVGAALLFLGLCAAEVSHRLAARRVTVAAPVVRSGA